MAAPEQGETGVISGEFTASDSVTLVLFTKRLTLCAPRNRCHNAGTAGGKTKFLSPGEAGK